MTTTDRILQARIKIVFASPFFGSLLMRLRMVPDETVETFCTDGREIRYSPNYAEELTDAELRGVLVHEVCHCAQGHLWRMEHRDLKKWNAATDYAVNGMLATYEQEQRQLAEQATGRSDYMPAWEVPKGFLLDPQLTPLSAEEIYQRLPNPPPNGGGGGGGDGAGQGNADVDAPAPPVSCGEFSAPAEEPSPQPGAPATKLEDDWKIAVTQAATAAKMQGQLPASVQRLVGELLAPRVPWREVLREFIRQRARDDYSFSRPNRRYGTTSGPGVGRCVLPGLHSERMGRLVIGVDTSGSITDHLLNEFQAEIQAALDECQPEHIEVIYCDAQVNGTQRFEPGDTVRLEAKGGGGTAFAPVFDHIAASSEEPPVACIYLTDGYGSFPQTEPDYPVLWATTESTHFPWGQVVSIK